MDDRNNAETIEILQYATRPAQHKLKTLEAIGLYFCLPVVFLADMISPYWRFVQFKSLGDQMLAMLATMATLPFCILGLIVFKPNTWRKASNRVVWWFFFLSLAWMVAMYCDF